MTPPPLRPRPQATTSGPSPRTSAARRLAWRKWLAILGGLWLAGAVAGCDSDKTRVTERKSAVGTVTVQVGDKELSDRPTRADCQRRQTPDGPILDVVVPDRDRRVGNTGILYDYHLLDAHLPPDLGTAPTEFSPSSDTPFRAVTSLFNRTLAGRRYRMIQFLAADIPGTDIPYRCRASRTNDTYRVDCTGARPFPWTAPGPIPAAEFRVEFQCPNE